MIRTLLPLLVLALMFVASIVTLFEPYRLTEFGRTCVRHVVLFFRLASGLVLRDQRGLLFQRINRSSPEKIFVVVKNNYATAAITVGQAVQWDFAGAADGVSVTRPSARATAAGLSVAGAVAEASIASAGFGLVQVYGYNANLRMRNKTGGANAMVPGQPIALNAAGALFCFENLGTGFTGVAVWPCGFCITATTGWTTAVRVGFLKCL